MSASRGLGDDIKKITAATGLDQLAKQIARILDEDCGCDDRQEWMNEKKKCNLEKRKKEIIGKKKINQLYHAR